MDLRGRIAVVTGGGSGIGRAMVECFAREGAKAVVVTHEESAEPLRRRAERLEQAVRETKA